MAPIPSRDEGGWQHLAHPVLNLIYEGNRQAAAALVALSLSPNESVEFSEALAEEIHASGVGRTLHQLRDPGIPEGVPRAEAIEKIFNRAWPMAAGEIKNQDAAIRHRHAGLGIGATDAMASERLSR